ncbi:glycosyltransferase family 2 protein [Actinoplanes sp. NPDC049681]|uniref:glycosyltransferase family 2 protein n=1 Tax=Actinoplanes sp. NPDC049681 TaxID=3363905 RepID=UPI0037B055CC
MPTWESGPAAVSVVVTACAAGERLTALLAAICAQRPAPLEILMVDNRPATSGVAELVRRLDRPEVRYVPQPRKGLSRARNAGLAAARAAVVAFTDDDVEPADDWLAQLAAPFADPSVACVTGMIVPVRVRTPAERWFQQFGGYAKGERMRRFTLESAVREGLYPYRAGRFGSGANLAFRRETLIAVGGFEETLGAGTRAGGGEDLDIFLTVLRAGHTLVYQPAARVAHPSHPEYRQLRRQLFGYGVGLSATMTKRFLTCAPDRRAMLRSADAAARYLLSGGSPKNRGREADYPKTLIAAELAGVLLGPPAYLWSRASRPWRCVALRADR